MLSTQSIFYVPSNRAELLVQKMESLRLITFFFKKGIYYKVDTVPRTLQTFHSQIFIEYLLHARYCSR